MIFLPASANVFRMNEQQGYKSITGLCDRPAAPAGSMSQSDALFDGVQRCGVCGRIIDGQYRMVGTKMACATCAAGQIPGSPVAASSAPSADSHSAFAGGVLYGVGAAVLGLALYAGFTIVTHFYFGYVALAVGWLVGKAIITGSGGVGGPRYQVAAVALTYAAISLASIPIMVAEALRQGSTVDWANMIGPLLLAGLASPFLDLARGPFGFIGLVILFVGLRVAYRMTRARQLVQTQQTVIR